MKLNHFQIADLDRAYAAGRAIGVLQVEIDALVKPIAERVRDAILASPEWDYRNVELIDALPSGFYRSELRELMRQQAAESNYPT